MKRKQDDAENTENALPPTQSKQISALTLSEEEVHQENGHAEKVSQKARVAKDEESLSPFSDEEDAKPGRWKF